MFPLIQYPVAHWRSGCVPPLAHYFAEVKSPRNEQMDAFEDDPHPRSDSRRSAPLIYKCQSCNELGDECHRLAVPIYIDASVHGSWKAHLDNAVSAINRAAPGLNLHVVSDEKSSNIRIYGTSENGVSTKGNFLSFKHRNQAEIYLCHNNRNMKRSSVHELLHALGYNMDCDIDFQFGQLKISELVRFDPHSIMLYCESASEEPVQRSKSEAAKLSKAKGRDIEEMSEVDKLVLNLIYRPCRCKSLDYNPHRSSVTGMWYCGRRVMDRHNHPSHDLTDGRCGPNNSANCPACRTLSNSRVRQLLDEGKWQGWSGLVYCGRRFGKVLVELRHDGYCGPNNGPSCPECKKILIP